MRMNNVQFPSVGHPPSKEQRGCGSFKGIRQEEAIDTVKTSISRNNVCQPARPPPPLSTHSACAAYNLREISLGLDRAGPQSRNMTRLAVSFRVCQVDKVDGSRGTDPLSVIPSNKRGAMKEQQLFWKA